MAKGMTPVEGLFTLAGLSDAPKRADAVYALEMKLAEVQWSPEDSRDATDEQGKKEASEEIGRAYERAYHRHELHVSSAPHAQ